MQKYSASGNPGAGPGDCCRGLEKALNPAFFKALCDPSRAAIIGRLAAEGGTCTVGGIAACCTVDLSVVSRHLATLRRAGIVSAEKRGREVIYRLRTAQVAKFLRRLADAVEGCCPPEDGAAGGNGGRMRKGERS